MPGSLGSAMFFLDWSSPRTAATPWARRPFLRSPPTADCVREFLKFLKKSVQAALGFCAGAPSWALAGTAKIAARTAARIIFMSFLLRSASLDEAVDGGLEARGERDGF